MSVRDNYNYRYGATINGNHTFRNWSLLPSTPPVIAPPEPKLYTVDIPGADGVLDLSESLTGTVNFGMRDATFEYIYYGSRSQWREVYRNILLDVHGQQCSIVLDEEPDMTYSGRLQISSVEFDGKLNKMRLSFEGSLNPWPVVLENIGENWLWDPFNFETGNASPFPTEDILLASVDVPQDEVVTAVFEITAAQAQGYPLVFEWTDGTSIGGIGVRPYGATLTSFERILDKNTKTTFDGRTDMYATQAGYFSLSVNGSYGMSSATCTLKIYARVRQEV